MKQRPEFSPKFGWPDYLFYFQIPPLPFGVVGEENKKSTRKKMTKI
jgi:hypothetical protein